MGLAQTMETQTSLKLAANIREDFDTEFIALRSMMRKQIVSLYIYINNISDKIIKHHITIYCRSKQHGHIYPVFANGDIACPHLSSIKVS